MKKENQKSVMDIRMLKLNKRYVPKKFVLTEIKETVAIGYFDVVEISAVPANSNHPFLEGYRAMQNLKESEKQNLTDYSSQEQMLFLNICEEGQREGICFSKSTIEMFWKDKSKPYLFLSMIHINHSGKIEEALKRIGEVFEKNYLSYISFDYCDIVLFVKNVTISEFLHKIKKLFDVAQGEERIIFDTFSLISFYPEYVEGKIGDKTPNNDPGDYFHATVNLSVRDYEKFKEWYGDVKTIEDSVVVSYDMFGRHDISIINENADTHWLMKVMEKLHGEKMDELFWTFETYIKVKDDNAGTEKKSDEEHGDIKEYDIIRQELKRHIEKLGNALVESKESNVSDPNRYMLPVYEVRDCICSIVKNDFAEEFVYCIYESFCHFIKYMTNTMVKDKDTLERRTYTEEKIAESYDNFFSALNTLVNSTMHNERQFVQATAFNAMYYSVPPKILAFYNSYIYHVKRILMDENGSEGHTFLIYPSYAPVITVDRVSLDDEPPCDRVLRVKINEEALYDMEKVMHQMIHELAHYVGSKQRKRGFRKKKVIHTLLNFIFRKCISIDQGVYQMLERYVDRHFDYSDDCSGNYLWFIYQEGNKLIQELRKGEELKKEFLSYYAEKKQWPELKMLIELGMEDGQENYMKYYHEQFGAAMYEDFIRQVNAPWNNINLQNAYNQCIELLYGVYSECYADLQMILVWGMSGEDYLRTFFVKQKVPIKKMLSNPYHMIRISAIFKVMSACGFWKELTMDSPELEKVYKFICQYNKNIRESETASAKIQEIKVKMDEFNKQEGIALRRQENERDLQFVEEEIGVIRLCDEAAELYEYLLEVLDVSLEEYLKEEKMEKIAEIRNLIKIMLDFKDVITVFNKIEQEIVDYKELCNNLSIA